MARLPARWSVLSRTRGAAADLHPGDAALAAAPHRDRLSYSDATPDSICTAGVVTGTACALREMLAPFLVGALFFFRAAFVAALAFRMPLTDCLGGVAPAACAARPSMR